MRADVSRPAATPDLMETDHMIPTEVADIAALICPEWAALDDDASAEVIAAAWRIHRAGYRK